MTCSACLASIASSGGALLLPLGADTLRKRDLCKTCVERVSQAIDAMALAVSAKCRNTPEETVVEATRGTLVLGGSRSDVVTAIEIVGGRVWSGIKQKGVEP